MPRVVRSRRYSPVRYFTRETIELVGCGLNQRILHGPKSAVEYSAACRGVLSTPYSKLAACSVADSFADSQQQQ